MRIPQYSVLFLYLLILFSFLGCKKSPTDEGSKKHSEAFKMSWYALDGFFLFQDRLPSNSYQYQTSEALYQSVKEPYTRYLNPTNAKRFLEGLTTISNQIGLIADWVSNGYVIRGLAENSPAKQSGLEVKDTITAINDQSVVGISRKSFETLISGNMRDLKRFKILRGTATLSIDVTIVEYLMPSVYSRMIDLYTGYIKISAFLNTTSDTGGTAGEFIDALENTKTANNTILDLRLNGGGHVSQCEKIASEFIPAETIIFTKRERVPYDNGRRFREITEELRAKSGRQRAINRKFYVLVNRYTASASEILVACLRKHRSNDIIIVGEPTYGKGVGQSLVSFLRDGNQSVALYGLPIITSSQVVPFNESLNYDQRQGIIPHIVVNELDNGESPFLAALDAIRGGVTVDKYVAEHTRLEVRQINTGISLMKKPLDFPICIVDDPVDISFLKALQ